MFTLDCASLSVLSILMALTLCHPCWSRIKIYGHCGNVYLGLCISIRPLNIDGPNNVLN